MAVSRSDVRQLLLDGTTWAVTAALLVLYALNWYAVLPPPLDLVSIPALAVMFLYLYLTGLGLLFKWLGGMPGFWIGFGAFTLVVVAAVRWAVDRVRSAG
ncbi:MAG: hypothetical protein ABEJ76_03160 [Halanaeroarchaeum sp.]